MPVPDFDEVLDVETTLLKEAADNIERYRKGDISLKFITAADTPVQGASVTIEQTIQDFLFGNIIFPLVRNDMESAEAEQFKSRFLEVFNFAIFPFYWRPYESIPGRPAWQNMLPAMEWCIANVVTTKGHPLVWTHEAGQPEWLDN